jgi:hypothetical protein
MRFPKFWVKAADGHLSAWGWSDDGVDEARAKAGVQLQHIRDWIAKDSGAHLDSYGYSDRPVREEVLREFKDGEGKVIAAVSRNSYGSLVLNTTQMMFVDCDFPDTVSVSGLLSGLFGHKKEKPEEDPAVTKIKARVESWLQMHPEWGWRVYRTKAGARLIATHQPMEPGAAQADEAFNAFEADPLYRGLCEQQQCFRARLTPKYWRCKSSRPPGRWPWENAEAEAAFRDWDKGYLGAAKDYATCRLIGQFGAQTIHPALRELVEFHDSATRTDTEMPLA